MWDSKSHPKRRKLRAVLIVSSLLLVGIGVAAALRNRETRLSAAVTIIKSGKPMEEFLAKPGRSVVEAWVRFPSDLGDDVFFGVDQEYLDGVANPHYVKSGDWMGLVALLRGGSVWVAKGTDDTMAGKPSAERSWEIIPLGQPLKPDTWHKIRCEVDFSKRRYVSFTLESPGFTKTLDLSHLTVDYPNAIPMSGRAMTYYVFAMRAKKLMKGGTSKVYFDDVKGMVRTEAGEATKVFESGFEENLPFLDQPVTLPVINLERYLEGRWYKEREEALLSSQRASFAKSGSWIGVCDADVGAP